MKKFLAFIAFLTFSALSAAPVCIDGTCYLSEADAKAAGVPDSAIKAALSPTRSPAPPARVAQGYMSPDQLIAFLQNSPAPSPASDLASHSIPVILLLVLLGGLAANLTPCVLPLAPVNLMLVGKGWKRGAAYALGITVAYGALGLAAAFGGLAFGAIQSNPWFNAAVAAVFLVLALAMAEVFFIDFSKYRSSPKLRGAPFLLGMGSAVLAGACVEPILLATLVLTAKWFSAGRLWAAALPFILGAGMGAPWIFAAAGFSVLPKPGKWMRWVTRSFSLVMFAMSAWYAVVAFRGFTHSPAPSNPHDGFIPATPATWPRVFAQAKALGKPVFVDVWATWCKNCLAMEKKTFPHPHVQSALRNFTPIRLQAEDPAAFSALPDFAPLNVKGLPALVIFESPLTP